MEDRIKAIREAFEALRSNIRPEGDAQAGALSVAIDQAAEAATAAPAPPSTTAQLLGNIAADLGALRDGMGEVHAEVRAMREAAGV